ncbi:MAG: hypothetical protein KAS93_00205, partial [Gammaproteobacteria bacterium]|nr:hypothetical protein [Gammaproteobacteria bacterium]
MPTAKRLLTVDLPAISDKLLPVELDGEDYISAPFCFRLTVLCKNHNIELKKFLGKPITIT